MNKKWITWVIFTTCCMGLIPACVNNASVTTIPTGTLGEVVDSNTLKECALELLEEEYSYESIRDFTSTSNGEVEIEVDDYGSLSCERAVQRYCKPGRTHVGCGGSRTIYKIKRNERGCEVVDTQTMLWDGEAVCLTPLPTPTTTLSPTPECIGDTWSYDDNIQTKIDIDPTLKITLTRFAPDVIQYKSVQSMITIYGDGRVIYAKESHQATGAIEQNTVEKQIPISQLQQIVGVLEEANLYAITPSCGGVILKALDAPTLDILIEIDGMVHVIKDNGACTVSHYDKYCDLGDKIDAILGTPW